jgi:hypothetical protein
MELVEQDRRGEPGLPEEVLATLRTAMLASRQTSYVLSGVSNVVRRHTGPQDRLFNLALEVKLGPLDPEAVKRLVTELPAGAYKVVPGVIQRIHELTSGRPYFVQVICQALFEAMVERGGRVATVTDLQDVVREKVLPNPGPFVHLMRDLRDPRDEALVLALSALQRPGRHVAVNDLSKELARSGLDWSTGDLLERLAQLAADLPSVFKRAENNQRRYRLDIGLLAERLRFQRAERHQLVVGDE